MTSVHQQAAGLDFPDEQPDQSEQHQPLDLCLDELDEDMYHDRDPDRKMARDVMRHIDGSEQDQKDIEDTLNSYTTEQWSSMLDQIVETKLDDHSTMDDVLKLSKEFHLFYTFPYGPEQMPHVRAMAAYPNPQQIVKRHSELRQVLGSIQYALEVRGMMEKTHPEGRLICQQLKQSVYGFKLCMEHAVSSFSLSNIGDTAVTAMLKKVHPFTILDEFNDEGVMKPHQLFFRYARRKAMNMCLRKIGGNLYIPKKNERGDFTYSYEPYKTIETFLVDIFHPIDEHMEWYLCFTNSPGTANQTLKLFKTSKTIPDLVRDKYKFSFQNGVYDLKTNLFYYYVNPGHGWSHDMAEYMAEYKEEFISIKYHDMEYPAEAMRNEMRSLAMMMQDAGEIKQDDLIDFDNDDDYQYADSFHGNLDMGPFDKILDDQDFDEVEKDWVYGLLGRMLHTLCKEDNWSILIFFLGVAGTGKSTLIQMLLALYDKTDVGVISNKGHTGFALQHVYNRMVYAILDIGEDCNLDQLTLQSMITGEPTEVTIRYGESIVKDWDLHGAFAGNVVPTNTWRDNSGSLMRRLVFIEFKKFITKPNPNLGAECRQYLPRFLKKITSCYRCLLAEHRNHGIRSYLPKKFKEAGDRALLELNPLRSCILECFDEGGGTEHCVSLRDFHSVVKSFCRGRSLRTGNLTDTAVNGALSAANSKMVSQGDKRYPDGCTGKMIVGIKIKPELMRMVGD